MIVVDFSGIPPYSRIPCYLEGVLYVMSRKAIALCNRVCHKAYVPSALQEFPTSRLVVLLTFPIVRRYPI